MRVKLRLPLTLILSLKGRGNILIKSLLPSKEKVLF